MPSSKKPYRRYYSQFVDGAWEVFDREVTGERGQNIAIAYCRNRSIAFALRDLLNERGFLFGPKNNLGRLKISS